MKDRYTIQTNLGRAVILGMIAILVAVVFYWVNSNTGTLIILIILVGVFLQYVLSKKIFRIIVDKETIKFEYLRLHKKTISYQRNSLKITKRTEVYFRGGKDIVFDIYNENIGKKIFEINKKSFKSENDYDTFKNIFEDTD